MPTESQKEELKRFADAYKVFTSSFTKEEFLEAFKKVIDFVKEMQAKNTEEMIRLSRMHEEMMQKIHGDNSGMIDEAMQRLKKEVMDMCEPMMKEMYAEHEEMMKGMEKQIAQMEKDHAKEMKDHIEEMNFIYDKVSNMRSGKDGKDADEEKIVEKVVAKLPQKDFSDIIKGLEDKLKDLTEQMGRIKTRNIYGGSPRVRDMWVVETPTGTINGTNTTFYISTNAIQDSETIIADGVPMRKTRDYTLAGRTLTMNTPPQLTLDAKFQKL